MHTSDPGSDATCVSTAVPRSAGFNGSLDALRSLATPQTVPSGILYVAPKTLFTIARFDGTQNAALRQTEWEQYYFDLQRGVLPGSAAANSVVPLETIRQRAQQHHAKKIVPIGIFDLRYHAPNKRLVVSISAAMREDRPIALGTDPRSMIEERHVFAASALLPEQYAEFSRLPYRHYGRTVEFILDPELYVTNVGEQSPSIEIDFADGFGFRPAAFGGVLAARYDEPGMKVVRVRQRTAAGELSAAFVLEVAAPAAVQPDTSFTVTATIPYKGQLNSGTAYVKYGSTNGVAHTQLVNPFVISEGFPGGYTWDYLYGILNEQNLLTTLLAAGYDAVVLTYGTTGANGGSDYIQRSAFVAVACIEAVIARRSGNAPLIVGGASMGGVVTRYALAYMEKNGLSHQARIFLSFDSPQQGATVPVSVQWFVSALAQTDASAKSNAALLSSNAAKQMMYFYVPSYKYSGSLVDPAHTEFYAELASLGYPKLPTTIGVSDGAGNGTQIIPDAAHVIDWYGNPCAYGDTWAEMTGSGQVASIYCEPISFWRQFSFSVSGCVNYDGAPGGLTAANGQLAQSLIDSDYGWVDHNYDDNCFIPTISGLDIANATGPYMPVPATGAASAFSTYFVSTSNNAHVLIMPQIAAYLIAQFGNPPAPALAAAGVSGPTRSLATGTYAQAAELSIARPSTSEYALALSADGTTLAALAWDGVYVFTQSGGAWLLAAKLQYPSATGLALSGNGKVLLVTSAVAGTAAIFRGSDWVKSDDLAPAGTLSGQFGHAPTLNADGSIAVVGAPSMNYAAAGAAYVFAERGGTFAQAATLLGASGEQYFGLSTASSADGTIIVIGGITFTQPGYPIAGYAHVFSGANWQTSTALPPPGTTGEDPGYGAAVSVSEDGSVVAVTACGFWQGNAQWPGSVVVFSGSDYGTRITIANSDTTRPLVGRASLDLTGNTLAFSTSDDAAQNAVYVYVASGAGWTLGTTPALPGPAQTGISETALSGDGSTFAVSAGDGTYVLSGQNYATATLLPTPVDIAGLNFGQSIAVSSNGSALLVGAPGVSNLVGAAYLYGSQSWSVLQSVPSPVAAALEQFGCTVALSSNADTAAFGARGDGKGAGCAYVVSGYGWNDSIRLAAPTSTIGDNFGSAIALSADGSVCVVGAPGTNENSGCVYVFSGLNWSQCVALTAADGQPGDNFGLAVAISPDATVIIAGAPNTACGGTAYLFSGTGWSQQSAVAPGAAPNAAFGFAVALSADGSSALIGAPQANAGAGAAYLLSGANWSQSATLPINASAGDEVGAAVALSGDASMMLVGAPGTAGAAGAAYVVAAGQAAALSLSAGDGVAGDRFGDAVALSADATAACIGAPLRRNETGTVYVFTTSAAQIATKRLGAATMPSVKSAPTEMVGAAAGRRESREPVASAATSRTTGGDLNGHRKLVNSERGTT